MESKKEDLEFFEDLRRFKRAMQGLNLDDKDIIQMFVDIEDIKQRTRINTYDIYRHTFMRILSQIGGDEWKICDLIADIEDRYFISKDGRSREEAILMMKAKNEVPTQNIQTSLSLPEVLPNKEPKKHFWSREKKT